MGLVPYLIGFHPKDSLVAIVLEDGRVVVTARVDLAAVRKPAALSELATRLFERYQGADGWFVAYTDDEDLAWDVLAGCAGLVGIVRLGRLLQVGSSSWRADTPLGPTGAITDAVSVTAAEAALLGLPARPSRQDLAMSITGPPDTEIEDLVRRIGPAEDELARLGRRGRRRMLQRLLQSPAPPDTADCVRLALLVDRPEGQLAALRALTRQNAADHLALWTAVVRRSLLAHQTGPLGLLGMAAWQTGDGALQMVCLERLDRLDPLAPLAGLLDWLNAAVLPPQEWDHFREPLLAAVSAQLTIAGRPANRPGR